jgi:tetratricopeptide (TPR) repeat protein
MAPALVLFLALSVSSQAAAQQDDVELTARTHFAAGEYQQALDIYAKLYAQTLHPTYLRNVGRCYQNMGKPDEAISALREYLRKAENLEPKHREEVEGFIREMEDLKRQRDGTGAGAGVGSPATAAPQVMRPALSVVAPSPTPKLTASPSGEDDAGASKPLYRRWWFWTGVGTVVVAAILIGLDASGGRGTKDVFPCPAGESCKSL